jgi:hypothetical protein
MSAHEPAAAASGPQVSQGSRPPGRDLIPGPPENEAGVLATRHRLSVPKCWRQLK